MFNKAVYFSQLVIAALINLHQHGFLLEVSLHSMQPHLHWKHTNLLHKKFNFYRPIFHCSAYHWHTPTDKTTTSAQADTVYNRQVQMETVAQHISTEKMENIRTQGSFNLTLWFLFLFWLSPAPGDPRAAFLQPPLHPQCTPAVLAGGDLSHVTGSPEDWKALWPHEVRGWLPAGKSSLSARYITNAFMSVLLPVGKGKKKSIHALLP